jgi:hypothetical protein
MKSHHAKGGGKRRGWFCHVRDASGRCQWAYCVRQGKGATMIFKVFPDDSDQVFLKSDCLHGAGRDEWHYPGQCRLSEREILIAAAETAAREKCIAGRVITKRRRSLNGAAA